MKKMMIGIACAVMLVGCSNEEKEKGSATIEKSKPSTEEVKTDKPNKDKNKSTLETTTESPATEAVSTETSEDTKQQSKSQQNYSFIDKEGYVDFKSDAFKSYMFNGNRSQQFGDIKVGMTKKDVEAIYGKSNEQGMSVHSYEGVKYGDIVVGYDDNDVVTHIFLNTKNPMTYDEVIAEYGEPTYDWHNLTEEQKMMYSDKQIIYDNNNHNGYSIAIIFDANDKMQLMSVGPDQNNRPDGKKGNNKETVSDNNSNGEVTKDEVKQFAIPYGKADKVNQTGMLMNVIIDEGDHFVVTYTNVSNAGTPHEMHIDKKTGDFTLYSAGQQAVEDKGNIRE